MNNNKAIKNLLIIIRHGERIDHIGKRPTFHDFDPELTQKGKDQAFNLGNILVDYLQANFPEHIKIKIYSSPFARTIQTSRYLLDSLSKNFEMENTININYYFSEIVASCDFDDPNFPSFIVLRNNFELLEKDLQYTKLNFSNDSDGIISGNFESYTECSGRLTKGIKDLINNLNSDNQEKSVYIVVSHAEPINQMNIYLGYPGQKGWNNVKFCNAFIYEFQQTNIDDDEDFKYIHSVYPPQK